MAKSVKACCHGKKKKGEKSDIDKVKEHAVTGYRQKERKVAGSAQGCCHGIPRKGEKREKWLGQLKGVVTGDRGKERRVACHGIQRKGEKSGLSRETEERREEWLVTGYRGKERKVTWSTQGCCHGILRKGEKSGWVSSKVLSRDTGERREK